MGKTKLAIESLAPMSAITIETEILDTIDEKLLIKNWNGDFQQLSPSYVRNNRTVYRVEDQSMNLSSLSEPWFQLKMKGKNNGCKITSSC
jgi:hypothetical protein